MSRELAAFTRARLEEQHFDTIRGYLTAGEDAPTNEERENAAKNLLAALAIVDLYEPVADYDNPGESYEHATGRACGLGEAVRRIAADHDHHSDYRPEWRR